MNLESKTTAKATVLVVDDSPDNLDLLNELLKDDYKVKLANTGEKALAIAESGKPLDLILLDIMMPVMDGLEVCQRLMANPATRHIPVIFLTGKVTVEDEKRGFDLGAVDYITKPVSPPRLLARVKAHLSLKEARDSLERRNLEDKLRFELAMAQQVKLNALKSTFVSMTTHEFRTPLTTILSSQELLRHYAARLSPQQRDDALDSIEYAVRRMVTMLDQVLTIGRADANLLEFKPKPVDIATLCERLREEALSGQSEPGTESEGLLALTVEMEDPMAHADEKLLRHILGNLLSNAIKYTPSGLGANFRARREVNGLVFEVQDQGIGIPSDDLPRLFGNFHRASNVGDIPGTGLGLTIVKRAVESHGGTISVVSELGTGTRFTVRIPLFQS
jgi:two-component system sensor histidine kinase/response regulator